VVSISGMTITNGNGIGSGNSDGGGILNSGGTLTITDSTISGNTGNRGGGVANNRGTLTITGSTISGNTAPDAGGGVYSSTASDFVSSKTTITNSTISGNTATTFVGGGIYNFGGLTDIRFSTITNNTARGDGDGSGVFSFGDSSTRTEVLSTIISANQGTDVDSHTTSSFLSKGYNLIGDGNATGSFNQTGDQVIGDDLPGLGPLANNGGPTQTHALLSGSPAIDAIPQGTNGCGTDIATDQRGVSRPQGSACDIGSFELEASDTEAPRVISTFPRGGGEIGPAANIRATFSEEMRPASVMNAFKLFKKGSTNQIAATVTYNAATDTATLSPLLLSRMLGDRIIAVPKYA
jgi:hypothetical protein